MAFIEDANISALPLTEQVTTPDNPPAGRQKLFIDDADHKLKTVNSSGDVEEVGGGSAAVQYAYWVYEPTFEFASDGVVIQDFPTPSRLVGGVWDSGSADLLTATVTGMWQFAMSIGHWDSSDALDILINLAGSEIFCFKQTSTARDHVVVLPIYMEAGQELTFAMNYSGFDTDRTLVSHFLSFQLVSAGVIPAYP